MKYKEIKNINIWFEWNGEKTAIYEKKEKQTTKYSYF